MDTFSYDVTPSHLACTKRTILSEIARIYDPLGWLSPAIIVVKLIIQQLWAEGVEWDTELPHDIEENFQTFRKELSELSNIQISRCILPYEYQSLELHGFCDSSEKAYGAVVYFRILALDGTYETFLIIGKSRVSPLKRLSLPRLELLGALLLSRLLKFILDTYEHLNIVGTYAWSDSKVTLAWIKSSPHLWQTFIANRVAEIQENVLPNCWHHVSSEENPADCASRGVPPANLKSHPLWWHGPQFLKSPLELKNEQHTTATEMKVKALLISSEDSNAFEKLIEKFSRFKTLKKVTAYCLRFIHNCRCKLSRKSGVLSVMELRKAQEYLVKVVQNSEFANDLVTLSKNGTSSNRLSKLSPFVDKNGLLRVGGCLTHSSLNYNSQHPIILPKAHALTTLIIDDAHYSFLHPGAQTLTYLLRQNFWILSARDAIRQRTFRCLRCYKARPNLCNFPKMADLPADRVTVSKPFQKISVDYAGPFSVRANKIRNAKVYKAYVCAFVCFSTKCVHLELVSDCTTESFLAAFRRFVARRGLCSEIYSDCGTNFRGANNQLREWYAFIRNKSVQDSIKQSVASEGVSWHFNPPGAPHFSGLVEAVVKSTKHHLTRVIGSAILTYDELHTLLCHIESVLNSRPLSPLSNDANDTVPLTPPHFLLGGPLVVLPESSDSETISLHDRWKRIDKMYRDFWKRWHLEYLNTLQQRTKWSTDKTSVTLQIGTLVLIKDENIPPLQWRLGRIVELHLGPDNRVRVASIRLANATIVKRPVVKLCPLPVEAN